MPIMPFPLDGRIYRIRPLTPEEKGAAAVAARLDSPEFDELAYVQRVVRLSCENYEELHGETGVSNLSNRTVVTLVCMILTISGQGTDLARYLLHAQGDRMGAEERRRLEQAIAEAGPASP